MHEESIPGYQILKPLGQGAYARVFKAVRESDDQIVALKVGHSHLDSMQLERFKREARVLSRLHHPNIATFFKVGAWQKGSETRPYLEMEWIDGQAIDQYCSAQNLSVPETVNVFRQVLSAVKYAHQKGVIHRDIKSSNVIVSQSGQVKLLDFGIALEQDETDARLTLTGELLGTLAFMSPEQVKGLPDDVDTRSDIYALGVLLFKMLTQHFPLKLNSQEMGFSLKQILEAQPMNLDQFDKQLDADLNVIVQCALEKNPDQRFQTLDDMDKAIQAWSNHESLTMGSYSYHRQIRWMYRRHKTALASLLLAFMGLGIGLIFAIKFALDSDAAKLMAEKEAQSNQRVIEFLNQVLTSADPEQDQGKNLTVLQVVQSAEASIEHTLSDEPRVEAHLRNTLGSVYYSLGDYAAAQRHFNQGLIRLDEQSDHSALTAQLRLNQIMSDYQMGVEQSAIEKIETWIEQAESDRMSYDLIRGAKLEMAAIAYFNGDLKQSMSLFKQVQRAMVEQPEHPHRLTAMAGLSTIHREAGDFDQARKLLQSVHDIQQQTLGDDHPSTLGSLLNLAKIHQREGDLDQAESMYLYIIAKRSHILGPQHPSTLITEATLLSLYISRGDLEQADVLSEPLLENMKRYMGLANPQTLTTLNLRAYLLEDLQRYSEAEALYPSLIKAYELAGLSGSTELFTVKNNQAMLWKKMGRLQAAKLGFQSFYPQALEQLGASHLLTAIYQGNYGEVLSANGDRDLAIPMLENSLQLLQDTLGVEHPRVIKAKTRLDQALK